MHRLTMCLVWACMIAAHSGREMTFRPMQSCSTDQPFSSLKRKSRMQCSWECLLQPRCEDFDFDEFTKDCRLYRHKPLFYESTPGCSGYKIENSFECLELGPVVPAIIPSSCCSIPFTLNGGLNYKCVDDGGGVGCFYGDRQWKLCQQPAEFEAEYEETATTALSADPAVPVPLLTINGWILMARKIRRGSLSVNQNWAAYRDGFGSAAGNDIYWLGLGKVYHFVQLASIRLRVEIKRTNGLWYSAEYSSFSISDEAGKYKLALSGYSGDAGDAMASARRGRWNANNKKFTTVDDENDLHPGTNLAVSLRFGWWFGDGSTSSIIYQEVGIWTTGNPVKDVQESRMLLRAN